MQSFNLQIANKDEIEVPDFMYISQSGRNVVFSTIIPEKKISEIYWFHRNDMEDTLEFKGARYVGMQRSLGARSMIFGARTLGFPCFYSFEYTFGIEDFSCFSLMKESIFKVIRRRRRKDLYKSKLGCLRYFKGKVWFTDCHDNLMRLDVGSLE